MSILVLLLSLHLVHPAAYNTLNSNPFFYWRVSAKTSTSGRRWPILADPVFYWELYKNAYKLRSFFENLLVGDQPILCGWEQAFQGPPRKS